MSAFVFKYGQFQQQIQLVSEPRERFQLRVKPSREVILKYPEDATEEEIQSFLKRKYRWLQRQIKFFEQFQTTYPPREYVSGESYWYLGRQYALKVIPSNLESLKLQQGKFMLQVQDPLNIERKREIVERWFLDKRAEIFEGRYQEMQKLFAGDSFPRLVIEEMPKRWGSYRGGKSIALHPLLIHAPKKCIDYVLVHELCHSKYPDHSSEFWNYLTAKMPEWRELKDELEVRLGMYLREE